MTQVFTPEKVLGLKEFLAKKRKEPDKFGVIELFMLLDDWLEQNQLAPTVVGLTDEQISDLADFIRVKCYSPHFQGSVSELIKVFLKTQTFARSPQSFEPSWDDAPAGASKGVNSTRWWNEKGEYIETTNSTSFERATPKVAVGQVWRRKETGGFSCEVVALSDEKVVIQVKECGDFAIAERLEFFAKCERVGDGNE